jgi:hypothetical protein
MLSNVEQCRVKAAEWKQKADETPDAEIKREFMDLAQGWLCLAELVQREAGRRDGS